MFKILIPHQGQSSSRASEYENVAKMSHVDETEKVRSTVHAIKLPPLVQQSLVGETPPQDEVRVCFITY